MTGRILKRSVAAVLITSIVSCASTPPEPEAEVNFTSIALVSPKEILDASRPETRGERAQKGAGTGLIAGTAGGAVVGAMACGPFLYGLCVVALAGAAGVAGTATGALYGFTGLPADKARELEKKLESLSEEHDMQSALVEHIRQQVAPEMLAEPETADIQAVLTIENMEFIKKEGKAHLICTVRATFESTESRRVPEYGYREFKGKSDAFELDDWLEQDSDSLEQAIRQSLLAVSRKVVAVLNDRWAPMTAML